jgi:two-component system response regulator YesN
MGLTVNKEELRVFIKEMLGCAMTMRDNQSKNQYRDIIGKALEYIDENYASESISLTNVAEHTNVSANYFSAAFSQEMKQTFVEYLTMKRMEKAKELLRNCDDSVCEISQAVGIDNYTYFCRLFKKIIGTTPTEYRKRNGT